ncbi:MAG: AAA family ATPase [Cellulosilyticaceae bacterium]
MSQDMQVTINGKQRNEVERIGELVAKKMKIKFVDKVVLEEAAKVMKMKVEYLEQFEEKAPTVWDNLAHTNTLTHGDNIMIHYYKLMNNELYVVETNIIKELAKKESCVFIGRCANYIFKKEKRAVRIFLYSTLEERMKKIKTKQEFEKTKDKERYIRRIDKQSRAYYNIYTGREWEEMEEYDLCIDTSKLSTTNIVELIIKYVELKRGIL